MFFRIWSRCSLILSPSSLGRPLTSSTVSFVKRPSFSNISSSLFRMSSRAINYSLPHFCEPCLTATKTSILKMKGDKSLHWRLTCKSASQDNLNFLDIYLSQIISFWSCLIILRAPYFLKLSIRFMEDPWCHSLIKALARSSLSLTSLSSRSYFLTIPTRLLTEEYIRPNSFAISWFVKRPICHSI